MVGPCVSDALVDQRGSDCGLDAQGVLVTIRRAGRRPHVNDEIVPLQLRIERGVHGGPERTGSGPVRGAIDGAAVTDDECRLVRLIDRGFELALQTVDRSLNGATFTVTAPA
jgi:hypothetical protein